MNNVVLEKDYYDLAMDFMKFLDVNVLIDIRKNVEALHDYTTEISALAMKTPLWETRVNESNLFFRKLLFKADYDAEKTVELSIRHFLEQISYAPTRIHVRSIIVFLVPVIHQSLEYYLEANRVKK